MKKSTKILGGVFAVLLAAIMCASLSVSFVTLAKVNTIEQNTKAEDNARENGVVIADRYEIKSTEQISNAYKSGDASQLSKNDKETLEKAEKILKKIIKKDMTDYEKELAVYEWMYDNIKHDDAMLVVVQDGSTDTYTPQGVLNTKKAVCVGYATTFRMFMQMLGIDCMVVHETELGHSWDLVKIGSNWYHTDLYFDIPSNKYSHFNLTDSLRQTDYNWDTEFYPKASSYEYCYAVTSAEEIKDCYKIPKLIKKALDNKTPYISYKISGATEEQKAVISTMLGRIQDTMSSLGDYMENYLDWREFNKGKDYIFYISISYPVDDNGNVELSDKIQEKINNAIEKSFGTVSNYNYEEYDYNDHENDELTDTTDFEAAEKTITEAKG